LAAASTADGFARPITAPAFVPAYLPHSGDFDMDQSVGAMNPIEMREQLETFDEEDIEVENDEETLARASAVVHQLQHNWVQERQHAIDELWQQLEQEYGFTPSRDLLDSLDGNGVSRDPTGEPHASDGLEGASATVASRSVEAEADQLTKEAAEDLAAARELRHRLEATARAECSGLLDDAQLLTETGNRISDAAQALPSRRPSTAPSPMAASLRMEIDRLRRADESLGDNVAAVAATPISGIAQLIQEEPPPLAGDLADWFEEVRILSSIVPGSSSPTGMALDGGPRPPRGVEARSSPSTPKSSPSSSTPRSKRELARIAEERAMDWDAARRNGGANGAAVGATATGATAHGGGEGPTRLGTSITGKPPVKPGGLAKNSFTCLQPLLSSDGTAGLFLNAHIGTLSGARCFEAVGTSQAPGSTSTPNGSLAAGTAAELQLDAILSECDEIDRIHESIQQKLSSS
jgi:hypothetical protein